MIMQNSFNGAHTHFCYGCYSPIFQYQCFNLTDAILGNNKVWTPLSRTIVDGQKAWFELSHPVFDSFIRRAFFLVNTKHLFKNYRRRLSTVLRWKGHFSLIQQLLSRKVLSSAHLSLDITENSHINTFWALQVLLLYHQFFIVRVKTYWTPLVFWTQVKKPQFSKFLCSNERLSLTFLRGIFMTRSIRTCYSSKFQLLTNNWILK